MRPHGPHSAEVCGRCDDGNMLVQDARKAVTDRADDRLACVDVLIYAISGIKHILDLADRNSDGHPVTGIRAREGGNGVDVVVNQPSFEGLDGRGTWSDELVDFLFREVVSVSGCSRLVRTLDGVNGCGRIPVMIRVAHFVQMLKELVEPVLLQPNVHPQRVIRGRPPDFNPAFGNVGPLVLHLRLLPSLVKVERFRESRLEETEQGNSPE